MWRWYFASVLASGAHAAFDAPIRWAGSAKNLVLAPKAFLNTELVPQELVILDRPDMLPEEIPHFTAQSDRTITWDSKCLEASGDKVLVNYCNGQSAQKWNSLPDGHGRDMIQVVDSNKCLDIAQKEGGLNGAPVGLRECDESLTEKWQFEESIAFQAHGPAAWYSFRLALISLMLFSAFGMLSLGAWFVRSHAKARAESDDNVAVSLVTPFAMQEKRVNTHGIVPAVMAASPADLGFPGEEPATKLIVTQEVPADATKESEPAGEKVTANEGKAKAEEEYAERMKNSRKKQMEEADYAEMQSYDLETIGLAGAGVVVLAGTVAAARSVSMAVVKTREAEEQARLEQERQEMAEKQEKIKFQALVAGSIALAAAAVIGTNNGDMNMPAPEPTPVVRSVAKKAPAIKKEAPSKEERKAQEAKKKEELAKKKKEEEVRKQKEEAAKKNEEGGFPGGALALGAVGYVGYLALTEEESKKGEAKDSDVDDADGWAEGGDKKQTDGDSRGQNGVMQDPVVVDEAVDAPKDDDSGDSTAKQDAEPKKNTNGDDDSDVSGASEAENSGDDQTKSEAKDRDVDDAKNQTDGQADGNAEDPVVVDEAVDAPKDDDIGDSTAKQDAEAKKATSGDDDSDVSSAP